MLAAPLAGQAIGAINGVLAAYARLPSFLITLGMLFAVNGMTLYLTQVTAIGVEPDLQIQSVFNGFLFGAPTIALWALTAWLLSVSAEYQAALARPHIVGGWTQKILPSARMPVRLFACFRSNLHDGFILDLSRSLVLHLPGPGPFSLGDVTTLCGLSFDV